MDIPPRPSIYVEAFHEALIQSLPNTHNHIAYTSDLNEVDRLFGALKDKESVFGDKLRWDDGSRGIHFKLTRKGEGVWKLNDKEITIKEIWLHSSSSIYNDCIVVHHLKGEPFIINGQENYNNCIVDDRYEISQSECENLHAKINNDTIPLKGHKVECIDRVEKEGVLIIGTHFHCALQSDSLPILRQYCEDFMLTGAEYNEDKFRDFVRDVGFNKYNEG